MNEQGNEQGKEEFFISRIKDQNFRDLEVLDIPPEKREKFRKKYLDDFLSYRNDYIDDIPEEIVEPGKTPDWRLYKCRGNFFNTVVSRLQNLIAFGIIEQPEQVEEIYLFLDDFKDNFGYHQGIIERKKEI